MYSRSPVPQDASALKAISESSLDVLGCRALTKSPHTPGLESWYAVQGCPLLHLVTRSTSC